MGKYLAVIVLLLVASLWWVFRPENLTPPVDPPPTPNPNRMKAASPAPPPPPPQASQPDPALVEALVTGRHAVTDSAVRYIYQATVADLLVRHRYDELEKLGLAAAGPEAMLAPPERTYVDFYTVFKTNRHFPTDLEWGALHDELKAWVAARPTSPVAHLALAHHELAAAWYQNEKKPLQGLSAMALRKSVQKTVDQAGELGKSPPWWWVQMELQLLSGASPEQLEASFKEAVKADPTDPMPYAQLALSHIQAWHGQSDSEWMTVADRMPPTMPGHLALLDLTMTGLLGDTGHWSADWSAQAASAKELASAYPRSAYAASLYLHTAMAANQADREAFGAVEGRADSRLLTSWDGYRRARLALGKLPPSRFPLPALTPPAENREALCKKILEVQATLLLMTQRYAELEAAFPQLVKQRTAAGGYRAWEFIEAVAGEGEDWRLPRCEEWRHAYPRSELARVVSACVLKDAAWAARGGGYANTVSDEGWRVFRARLEEADGLLQEVKSPAFTPWRVAAQLPVSMGLSAPPATYKRLCEEALKARPDFRVPVAGAANALLPRWHGEPGDVERLAGWAADVTNLPGYYAYVAYSVAWTDESDFFATYSFKWPRLKASFEDLIRRFPRSRAWLNLYARFAVMAGDRPTARKIFARIGEDYEPDAWSWAEFTAARSAATR